MQEERKVVQVLEDQISYLKSELDWYRQENIRLQGLVFGSKEEPESLDPIEHKPLRGVSTPSSRKLELERLHRIKAKEQKEANG